MRRIRRARRLEQRIVDDLNVQVPAHRRLSEGFDKAVAGQLVKTNWIRTFAWTARAVVAALMIIAAT